MSSTLAQYADKTIADLKRRIIIYLSQKGVSSVGRLDIEVMDETVTFRGTVSSFHERQLCLSCQHLPGVRKVVDNLRVSMPSPGSPQRPSASVLGRPGSQWPVRSVPPCDFFESRILPPYDQVVTEPKRFTPVSEHASFETELHDEAMLVRFTQPSLIFPDQVRAVEDFLSATEQSNLRLVVLDFAQVEHISSSCWGGMIRLNGILNSDERKLRICNLRETSTKMFHIMRFGDVLDLRASPAEALDLE